MNFSIALTRSVFLIVFLTNSFVFVSVAQPQPSSAQKPASSTNLASTTTAEEAPEPEIDVQPYLMKKQFYRLLTLLNENFRDLSQKRAICGADLRTKKSESLQIVKEAKLYLQRGTCYYSYCDYRKAIADFDYALKLDPNSGEASVRKAICLCRLNKLSDAKTVFLSATKQKLEGELVYLTGRGLLETGEIAAARDYLIRYIRSNGVRKTEKKSDQEVGLRSLLGLVLFAAGDKDGAIYQLNAALEAKPNEASALLTRARVYLSRHNFRDAFKDAQTSTLANEDPNAYLIAAEAAFSLNEVDKARDKINRALILYGKSIPAQATALRAQISLRSGDLASAAADGLSTISSGYVGQPLPILLDKQVTYEDSITSTFSAIEVSPHFVFYSDITPESLHKYVEAAENFAGYVERKLLPLTGNYPRGIFILHDKMAERKFLKEKMGFPNHVHGVYLTKRNAMVTYDGAGLGTFLHELLHTFLHEEKELDFWAEEGIPAFFETCYGYVVKTAEKNGDSCSMELTLGFPETWEKKWMGGKERHELNIKTIVDSAKHSDADHEDEQRQVALFLNHEGKLFEFFSLTVAKQKKGFKTYIEACFDKSLDDLQEKFALYMKELEENQKRISELPPSAIFPDREEFENFKRNHPDAFLPF